MKRALWIALVAVALVTLAAVGWVARLFDKSSADVPSRRQRERLVRTHQVAQDRRRESGSARDGRPLASALAR
jgi:hypothetical protein